MAIEHTIQDRKNIWIALSKLYLDTELESYVLNSIAKQIHQSSFTLTEVLEINKTEVFPVLYSNLMSVAGVWTGFDEEWLFASIPKKKNRRNFLKGSLYNCLYRCMRNMFDNHLKNIEIQLQQLERGDRA